MKRPSERDGDGVSHGRDEMEFGDEKDEDEVEDEPSLLAWGNAPTGARPPPPPKGAEKNRCRLTSCAARDAGWGGHGEAGAW
jgi:hypothetical protein